ncbi:DUF3999 domain-containing protein [Cognatilysobacter tabacisoli]|uniref:DUF3999 domain-containing protein n=1 Tax=Cognatilysobacter tabacisoli TaxID=2315424 RepID=UPI000E6B09C0|nr:DUF3999 domain-containing protein [Lysobacter tabacisoli]
MTRLTMPVLLGLLLGPLAATAAPRDDYAAQWPLTLGRDGDGAYRVVLDEAVYRQVGRADIRDLDVLNGDGRSVPTALFAPDNAVARPAPRIALPWYPLPAVAPSPSSGWRLSTQADADGHLRRVDVQVTDPAAATAPRTAVLIDLSRVREAVTALYLTWKPVDELDVGLRVEASDDLDRWQPLAARGRLVDLTRETQRLVQRRVALYGLLPHYQRARYLRLVPDRLDQAFEITSVQAELASAVGAAPTAWLTLDGRRQEADGRTTFEFDLGGRFPIEQIDLALDGYHAGEWRLESRDDADADWRPRSAPWVAYRIDGDGGRSPARALGAVVRDRYWRLGTVGSVDGTPRLRAGYRPEVVVFVAQGAGPYTLVAGSAHAARADAPLPHLVTAIRRQRGAEWQPTTAYLGRTEPLAGDAARSPRRDWKAWLLWGVLALGALVVAAFALTLLRVSRPAYSADAADAASDRAVDDTAAPEPADRNPSA